MGFAKLNNLKMRFLTMDPSMRNTALVWGKINNGELLLTGYELIRTKGGKKPSVAYCTVRDCKELIRGLNDVISSVEPHVTFAETPSGSQNSSGAKSYGISCCLISLLPECTFVTPGELKKLVNGTNSAEKEEIMAWIEERHPNFLPRKKDGTFNKSQAEHIADAIAAAYVGLSKINKS